MTGRTTRFDVVTFGENSLDTLVLGPADRSDDVARRPTFDLPGGQAATLAVGCRRLGWRSRYIGAFGDDESGRIVREALAAEDVDVHAVVRARVPSRRALLTIDPASGDRHVISYRDSRLNLTRTEINDHEVLNTRLLMVDATDVEMATRLASRAKRAGVTTLVDTDFATEGARELLNFIDLIVLPAHILAILSGEHDVPRGLRVIGRTTGARAVIVTMGADGAAGWMRDAELRVASGQGAVVDTVGAGDGFRAGIAAAWLGAPEGQPPGLQALLDAGTFVAGANCRGRGAQSGLPRKTEVPAPLRGPL